MTSDELRQRLRNVEDGWTERKSASVSTEAIRNTLVAFANSVTGDKAAILFIGVDDDGTPSGVSAPEQKQKDVRRIAVEKCYPPITTCNCAVFEDSGKHIVAAIVSASDNRPHFAGIAYIRVGPETVKASDVIFDEIIASRNTKAGIILREKARGKHVIYRHLVRWISLDDDRRMTPPSYYESLECEIIECNAHFVRLAATASETKISEPLSKISISYDERKQLLLLTVDDEGRRDL